MVLVVRDIERALAFYRDVLGCRPLREAEWRRGEARFPSLAVGDGQMLNVHQAGTPVNPAAPIAEVEARLARHGVPVELGPVRRAGGRGRIGVSVYFRDPDGNLLEVMSYEDAA
jgi:catechol 2,3-dioxygenase-like lactoylglutathione lyase family enzyme